MGVWVLTGLHWYHCVIPCACILITFVVLGGFSVGGAPIATGIQRVMGTRGTRQAFTRSRQRNCTWTGAAGIVVTCLCGWLSLGLHYRPSNGNVLPLAKVDYVRIWCHSWSFMYNLRILVVFALTTCIWNHLFNHLLENRPIFWPTQCKLTTDS